MSNDITEPPTVDRDDILVLDDPYFEGDAVAIVTGAASGIGRATALAHNGVTVVATDVDTDGLAETEQKHSALELDGELDAVTGDLTEDDELDSVVASAADLGPITFLANIGGLQNVAPIEVGNLFTFGFSRHSKYLDAGDLLWDGGYSLTYD